MTRGGAALVGGACIDEWKRNSLSVVRLAGFVAVAGQSLAFPVGGLQVSWSMAGLTILWIYLMTKARWRISPVGLCCYSALLSAGYLSLVLGEPLRASTASFIALALCYTPVLLMSRSPVDLEGAGRTFFEGAISAIKVGAVLALFQALLQWRGSGFWDPIRDLPLSLQITGYNNRYSTQYVDLDFGFAYKPNGVLFLEPSSLSSLSALGIVWVLLNMIGDARPSRPTRRPWMWLAIWFVTLAISISASGIPVLLLGVFFLLPRIGFRPGVVLACVGAGLAALHFGLLSPIIAKLTEGTSGDTSTSLRLLLPYRLIYPLVADEPVLGHGPGSADTRAMDFNLPGLQVPTPLKALYEYGYLGTVVLLLIVLVMLARRNYPVPLAAPLLFMWLVPAGQLLSPTSVAFVLFVLPHWAAEPKPPPVRTAVLRGSKGVDSRSGFEAGAPPNGKAERFGRRRISRGSGSRLREVAP